MSRKPPPSERELYRGFAFTPWHPTRMVRAAIVEFSDGTTALVDRESDLALDCRNYPGAARHLLYKLYPAHYGVPLANAAR